VRRHAFLRGLHEVLRPRTYFEIGVREGMSLALSRAQSVGVDPAFVIDREIWCDVHLVRTTSDEFFAREHPFAHFTASGARPIVDLAFIDGMHLAEYALRDLVNTERWCRPGSVLVLDDMLPRTLVQAGRGRTGSAEHGLWAGDVYKVIAAVRDVRPDLLLLEVDTLPTGTLLVLLPDAADRSLLEAYDGLARSFVTPDPQTVPAEILDRRRAMAPERVLASSAWARVAKLRDAGRDDRESVAAALTDGGLR
jgi:Methyltransferase domain